jgi:hypothetical protein
MGTATGWCAAIATKMVIGSSAVGGSATRLWRDHCVYLRSRRRRVYGRAPDEDVPPVTPPDPICLALSRSVSVASRQARIDSRGHRPPRPWHLHCAL